MHQIVGVVLNGNEHAVAMEITMAVAGVESLSVGIGALGLEAAWLGYNINARFGGPPQADVEDRPSCRSKSFR